MFNVEDVVLRLKGELIRIAIGTTTAVGQSFQPTFLIAIDDLISGFAGDPELTVAPWARRRVGVPQT